MGENDRERQERAIRFKAQLEASPQFRAVQAQMQRAAASTRQGLKAKMDANAEFQRRRAMSADEKAAGAIDRMTERIQVFTENTTGEKLTHEQAHKKAITIAKKAGVKGA